jgi:N-acyl-D-glutamate deacylase
MQQGMVADITIFDPETATDKSTYLKGSLPSEGIPYVIVNGAVVVDNSEVLRDVNPGQPIRFEPTDSKLEPLSADRWTSTYYVVPHDFGGGVPGIQPHYDKSVIRCCE